VAQPHLAAPQQGLQVTEKAIKHIRAAIAKEGISPAEGGLRLGVMGGGCSGFLTPSNSIRNPVIATAFLIRRCARIR